MKVNELTKRKKKFEKKNPLRKLAIPFLDPKISIKIEFSYSKIFLKSYKPFFLNFVLKKCFQKNSNSNQQWHLTESLALK